MGKFFLKVAAKEEDNHANIRHRRHIDAETAKIEQRQ